MFDKIPLPSELVKIILEYAPFITEAELRNVKLKSCWVENVYWERGMTEKYRSLQECYVNSYDTVAKILYDRFNITTSLSYCNGGFFVHLDHPNIKRQYFSSNCASREIEIKDYVYPRDHLSDADWKKICVFNLNLERHIKQMDVEEIKKPKIFIAVPCYSGNISIGFFNSITANFANCSNDYDMVMVFHENDSLVCRARNVLASTFLRDKEFDYLLWLDDDLSFPPDTIRKLIESNKDIVGAPYVRKNYDWKAIEENVLKGFRIDVSLARSMGYVYNNQLQNTKVENGCLEVNEIGTGIMLIKRKVFEDMVPLVKSYKPYETETKDKEEVRYTFFDSGVGEDGKYLSEDYLFCSKARQLGYQVYLRIDIPTTHKGICHYQGNMAALTL